MINSHINRNVGISKRKFLGARIQRRGNVNMLINYINAHKVRIVYVINLNLQAGKFLTFNVALLLLTP